jgi:hypothetical protein
MQLATTEQDYGWVAKVQDRVYGRQDELNYGLLGFTGVLRVQTEFYGSFLGVVSAFAYCYRLRPSFVRTPALPTLPYCLDDRALRRHIHSILPHCD